MPKKPVSISNLSGGAISTNCGSGALPDGTRITFMADVSDGVIDKLNATISSPVDLVGKRITRDGLNASWRFV